MHSPFASVAPYPDGAGRIFLGLRTVLSSSKRSAAPIVRKELALSSWDKLPLHLWRAVFELIGPSPEVAARRVRFHLAGFAGCCGCSFSKAHIQYWLEVLRTIPCGGSHTMCPIRVQT